MERPADQPNSVAVVNAVDVQSPDRKVVRRRFVQQTLFPLKPHEPKIENSPTKGKKKVEEIVDDEECCGSQGRSRKRWNYKKKGAKRVDTEIVDDRDDEEECCGSQGRGRKTGRKPKQNSTPQRRVSQKVAANGSDASIIALDDVESLDNGIPQQQKDKQRAVRNGRTQGNKGSSTAKISTHPSVTHQTSQPVPDLRLEAKQTAEENSRLFAGKQVHPFFSAWKNGKKDQVAIEGENNGWLNRGKGRHAECGPIHVFEDVQIDTEPIDWSNWTLCEGTFCNPTGDQERTINFGADLNISEPSPTLINLQNLSMGQYSHEDASAIPNSDSLIVVDEEVTPYDLVKKMEKDFEIDELGFIAGSIGNLSSTSEQQKAILLERIVSYYLSRTKHPENSLWTNKYQPEKASEVCGNSEAVKFINEWLHLWHSTDFRVSGRSSGAEFSLREEDSYSYGSDSDLENVDEEPNLKNVLLVTGPVGSGKSAAIYACAKEQGFQVIEVNASDWRNGAILKQKFGEAVGSHWLKRSQENPVGSPSKGNLKSSPAVFANDAAALDLNKSEVEVVSLSEEEDSADGMQWAGDDRIPCGQSEIKTVILFEDVDATLCEDRGFISTIQQLAETGKRPMILTSNGENPVLPDSLAREEVFFTLPSLRELSHHMYLVCAAEKANVRPLLIERCIRFCGGDIRKTLMHLQFWCQNKEFLKDGKLRMLYSPLMFNLEAGHCTLPKLIPWELPSSLSVFVEAEIAKILCNISSVENDSFLEVIEEEVGNTSVDNVLDFGNDELGSIEAKKKAILRANFLHVDNDIIAVSNACDLYNSSDSPVAFARRNVRRKLGTVLSDSEDDIPNVSGGLAGGDNKFSLPADEFVLCPCPAVNDTSNALDDELVRTGAVELKLSAGTAHLNHLDLSPVGNSCGPTSHRVQHAESSFAEIQHQDIELAGTNNNSVEAVLNLFSDQLLCPVESKLEADRNLFTVVNQVYQNSSPIGNPRNQSIDHDTQYTETNAMETQTENVHCGRLEPSDYCVNPLSGLSQHCEESKMAVKRCLFPQTVHVDPLQSTNQFSEVLNMTDVPHQSVGERIMDHGSQGAADCFMNSFTSQFLYRGQANVENIECKHPEIASLNPLGFTAVDNSLNRLSEQLFHSQGEKPPDIQNQCVDAGPTRNMNRIATVGDPLNQLDYQFFGIAKLEEIQVQDPGSADVRDSGGPPEDYSLGQMGHQSPFDGKKIESSKHQLPGTAAINAGIDVVNFAAVGHSMNLENGKVFEFVEGQQSQCSEATNFDRVVNGCQSMDLSCVPESTFVPETEINEGREFLSKDLTEIVSPLTIDVVGPSVLNCITSGHIERCRDIDLNDKNEEMGESQSENEHLEASTSGCQVMDECSRMDFCKRSTSFWSSRHEAKNHVQEKWNELRQKYLGQHFMSENKYARHILELARGMSNLISEADLLLNPSRFPTDDSPHQDICFVGETCNFGWRDQQIQMASAIAERGYCSYARSIDSLRLAMGIDNRVHLAWELLASTSSSMALGKLLRLDRSNKLLRQDRSNCQNFSADESLKWSVPTVEISLIRERELCLQNMLMPIVPLRSHLALRGNALHDYLSSLAQISSSEASHLAESNQKRKGRRVRAARSYLSSGGLDLSSDDISLLNEYIRYRKVASKL